MLLGVVSKHNIHCFQLQLFLIRNLQKVDALQIFTDLSQTSHTFFLNINKLLQQRNCLTQILV